MVREGCNLLEPCRAGSVVGWGRTSSAPEKHPWIPWQSSCMSFPQLPLEGGDVLVFGPLPRAVLPGGCAREGVQVAEQGFSVTPLCGTHGLL